MFIKMKMEASTTYFSYISALKLLSAHTNTFLKEGKHRYFLIIALVLACIVRNVINLIKYTHNIWRS